MSSGGRLPQPTATSAPPTRPRRRRRRANNLNRLIIDDATSDQNPDPIVFGRGGQPLSAEQHAARR